MPYGEVKISNPSSYSSSSSSRRSFYPSAYKLSSSSYIPSYSRTTQFRATSLDRSSSRALSTSGRTYNAYDTHSTYKSGDYGRSLTSSDILRKYETNEVLSRPFSLSNSSTIRNYNTRKCIDAIPDSSSGNPVLTNYRDLKETSSSLETKRFDRRLSSTNSTSSQISRGSIGNLSEGSAAGETLPWKASSSLASVSSSRSSLSTGNAENDENSNRFSSLRTKHDSNHNPMMTYLPNHLHHPSSSSLLSPSSSTDDVSDTSGHHHVRRSSTLTGGTSGYASSDHASTTSSNYRSPRDSASKGGLVGLRNLGNTCFMNSVLQCLSNTKPLLEYCLKDFYVSEINTTTSSMKGALFKAFANLLQSMWKGTESAVNPQTFKNQIQKFAPRFMGYSQQDAQEFLRYLLQGLHEDVNRVGTKPKPNTTDIDEKLSENQKSAESWKRYLRFDDSKIVDIFVGQLKSTLQCTVCGHSSVTFDPFWDLSLPIPKAMGQVQLRQCFDLFTRVEHLDGDEKPTCSKCKQRRNCTKSLTIQKFPKVLVIHLKRFSPSERYRSKLSTNVEFPATSLDLGSYASNTNRNPACMYNLYAVSNHSGTIFSGHYTAYCKHPYTGEWHDFNDSNRVLSLPMSSLASSEAYVLFYELASQSSRL